MQDSIEDFIRISKNTKEDTKEPSKKVQVTPEVIKQCNARATKIVEFSIEGKLRPEVFLRCLPCINQSHFQDIVEERAISKLCGYPICGKKIPDMPKKQYYISTKENRVYDIVERKNYCSNFCYKAGLHIKKQVENSPLWLRKVEDIPNYQLLPNSESGLPGEEIDQGIARPVPDQIFTSVSAFASFSLTEVVDNEQVSNKKIKINNKTVKPASKYSTSAMSTIDESDHVDDIITEKHDTNNINKECKTIPNPNYMDFKNGDTIKDVKQTHEDNPKEESNLKSTDNNDNDQVSPIKNISEQSQNITESIELKSHKSTKKKKPKDSKLKLIDLESQLKTSFEEWFTLETYIHLFGDVKVKEKLSDSTLVDFFNKIKLTELHKKQQIKYIDICRKLHMKELADEKFDSRITGNIHLDPLPDYKELKQENRELDLKVKSFYGGVLYETQDPNFPIKSIQNKEQEETVYNPDEGPPAVLPLVDTISQNAIRRKIFLSSAKKAMQQLILNLRLPPSTILTDLQMLIKTFNLKADNIVFKPVVWNYISIGLIKLLSLRNKEIDELLDEGSVQYMNVIINEMPSQHGFIYYILDLVQNLDLLIQRHLECNTV